MLFSNKEFDKIRKNTFENLYHELQKMESNNLTDVTLVSEDLKSVEAHRVILSTASPVLNSLFLSHSQVGSRTVIFLSGVSHENMEALVSYIYLGQADVEDEEQFNKLLGQFQHKSILKSESNIIKDSADDILTKENKNICKMESNIHNEINEFIASDLKKIKHKNNTTPFADNSLTILGTNTTSVEQICKNEKTNTICNKVRNKICSYCSIKVEMSKLDSHLSNCHAELLARCDHCGQQIVKAKLRWHVKVSHETIQPTKLCGIEDCQFEYYLGKQLDSHKRKHHASLFKCDQCTHSTWATFELKRHVREKHQEH